MNTPLHIEEETGFCKRHFQRNCSKNDCAVDYWILFRDIFFMDFLMVSILAMAMAKQADKLSNDVSLLPFIIISIFACFFIVPIAYIALEVDKLEDCIYY